MSHSDKPVLDPPDDGFVGAGRPLGSQLAPISDEDAKRLEEAWNNPAFYDRWKGDDGFVGAGWVSKTAEAFDRRLLLDQSDIEKLPLRARVAFAARCAHRVLPLVSSSHERLLLARAVHVAEHARASTQTEAEAVASTARAAAQRIDYHGPQAAWAAAEAAVAYAAARARADVALDDPYASDYVASATNSSVSAVSVAFWCLVSAVTVRTITHLTSPTRDFDRLLTLAQKEQWTDDTPVPPSVFGPMWEGTPPDWWTDEPLAEVLPPQHGEEHAAPTSDTTAPH